MKFITPSPDQVHVGLRAMRTLIDAKPTSSPLEEDLLSAIQRVWGTNHDPTRLTAISPEELAREMPEGPLRRQLIAGLTALALYDGEAQPGEIALIAAYASALGVADGVTRTLRQYAEGHFRRMRFDLIRRSWVAKKIREEVLPDQGLWGALRTMLQLAGKLSDPELVERCRALERYPAGSLGRAYHEYMIANGFSFPGTRGAPPEMMLVHDCAHLLSGYATDAEGEVQVLGFSVGFMDQDPTDHLLAVLMQFHVGVQITPGAPPERWRFNPETFLHAVRRGSAMSVNLNDRWDPWAVFGESVADLRVRYRVPPLGAQLD